MSGKTVVIGASGFLGSHVTRQLVSQGRSVRIVVRPTSDTRMVDDLDVERCYGDVLDRRAMEAAMAGCDTVFYCVVDTRAWLRDPAPLYRTNVDGLVNAMEAALANAITRFVFTSTVGTMGRNPAGVATEADAFNWWDSAPAYIRCRVEAENRLLQYCRERGLPGIACCVANTYGPGDLQPTPHGKLLIAVSQQKMPFYIDATAPCVGIEDAAAALLLAEQHGRIGERYIISESGLTQKELYDLAAAAAGVQNTARHMPTWLLYGLAAVGNGWARLRGRDSQLSVPSVRLMHIINDMDASKARRELGWQPQPVARSVERAIDFWRERGMIPR